MAVVRYIVWPDILLYQFTTFVERFMHASGIFLKRMTTAKFISEQYFKMTYRNFMHGTNIAHGTVVADMIK